MTAVITGAAGAIGRAIAERLASEGRRMLLVDVTDRVVHLATDLVARGAIASPCVVDITAEDAADRILTAAGALDAAPALLVNNAGITRDGRVHQLSDEQVRQVIRINLVAPLRLTERLGPQLAPGSAVVNIASRAGFGNFGQANYVASKAALMGATRAMALRWAPDVRVNAVAPGLIATTMTAAMPPSVLDKLIARVPARRAGEPQEIADAVAFLGSERASYVTGQVLVVCGGRSIEG